MMNLVRWNPGREMATRNNQISRFFDESFFPTRRLDDDSGVGSWNPKVDIYENDNNFVIKAELPGLEKKDFKIDLDNDSLTIASIREDKNQETHDNYTRREFRYNNFSRSSTLPELVDAENIAASHKNGVLSVNIPKKEEAKAKPARQIAIK